MKPMTLLSMAIAGALGASHAVAAPSTPSLDWKPQNYSFVEVDEYGRGSYNDLVQRVDEVQIEIKWNAWSGDGGDSYKVYFDDQVVNQGTLPAGTQSGTVTFPYDKGGRHQLKLALCEGGVDGPVRDQRRQTHRDRRYRRRPSRPTADECRPEQQRLPQTA